jgi:hypothetical protein
MPIGLPTEDLIFLCLPAGLGFQSGKSPLSETEPDVFQRIRDLEDKLELQRRHLKELEEKVGGGNLLCSCCFH